MKKIIYEDNHLLVVEKPRNMVVQEDDTKDLDLLSSLKLYVKNKYNKPGDVYLGLVHRLDRPVGGVMVFARTSKSASRLSESIKNRKFNKTYLAVVNGSLDKNGVFEDYLKKDEKLNKSFVDKNGKFARLSYEVLGFKNNLSLVKINLDTGRSHQIRVQFSSREHSLWGDQKYNKDANVGEQLALWSYELEFEHPVKKEMVKFKCLPSILEYPWNLFEDKEFYDGKI